MNSITPAALIRETPPELRAQTQQPAAQHGAKRPPLMRRYECLTPSATHTIIAPALPLFEAAFSAFARGTVFKTTHGPCPVEDLVPGMMLETVDHGPQPLLWRGMMNIVPGTPTDHPESQQLARVMQGSFGFARPESDLMLGPAAEIIRQNGTDHGPTLTPIADLVDGHTVFRTSPPSSVQVFHLVLPDQCSLIANGVHLASYHPPLDRLRLLGPNMKQLFMSFFPHVKRPEDFGTALRREPTASRDADLNWA